MTDRFDKFTERAQRVLTLAKEEAQSFGATAISSEHLLLDVVGDRSGVACNVLTRLGAEPQGVKSAIEALISKSEPSAELGLSDEGKAILRHAVDEARGYRHNYVGTEHLLLGLISERGGMASRTLEGFGVTLDLARNMTTEVLRDPT